MPLSMMPTYSNLMEILITIDSSAQKMHDFVKLLYEHPKPGHRKMDRAFFWPEN